MALGRQHPVLSPVGCLGGLMFIIGVAVALFVSGGAIFSPGELTAYAAQETPIQGFKAHAEFENNCLECHEPLHGLTTERCERCHTDVNEQRTTGTGLHGGMTNTDVADCQSCHRDHQGREFDPNALALKKFDHAAIGFSLAWHYVDYDQSAMKCEACHTETTFTLDAGSCVNCHLGQDATFVAAHTEAFGVQCLACHDGVDKMHNFDHAQTRFPLEGKHAAVNCADCHTASVPAPDTAIKCAACHNEPPVHAGLFSADCAECHTPAGWKPAKLGEQAAFDHAATGFQLVNHSRNYDGSTFACRDCHTANDFSFTPQTCADCHRNRDLAFMTRHVQQYGPNCASCHDGAGNMKNFDHNTVFILDGGHATLDCAACHVNQQFKGTPKECSACHREPEVHAGVFGLKCDSCHTTTAWAPAQLVQHIFPLDHGGQGEIACATCHTNTYTTYTCYGCHEHDPAKTQDEHQNVDLGNHELDDCAACHATGQKQEGSN
ncbi:MAG: hypothetical protein HYZ49_00605 [Chloroflexi bacterium]|nr:hypothetical protein [Chloroflexota bacterium]